MAPSSGLIGGYQGGGDTAAISYSSYLGAAVQRLYQQPQARPNEPPMPTTGLRPPAAGSVASAWRLR